MWMITFIKKCAINSKKGVATLELLSVIVIIAFISAAAFFKYQSNPLDKAAKRLVLYLQYTRFYGLSDNKFNHSDPQWFRARYSFRIRRCNNQSGIYYTIHSDADKNGYIKQAECIKDPLSNKYIYSSNICEQTANNSRYVLLTKEFGVVKAELSCNTTDSLGMIIFGEDGKIYSKFDQNDPKAYEITQPCTITLYNEKGDFKTIVAEPQTGYIYLQN